MLPEYIPEEMKNGSWVDDIEFITYMHLNMANGGKATLAIVVSNVQSNKSIWDVQVGIAYCSPHDTFTKKKGRDMALMRALRSLHGTEDPFGFFFTCSRLYDERGSLKQSVKQMFANYLYEQSLLPMDMAMKSVPNWAAYTTLDDMER